MAQPIPISARLLPGTRQWFRTLRTDVSGVVGARVAKTPGPFRGGTPGTDGLSLSRGQAAHDGEFRQLGQSLVAAPDAVWTTPLPSERFAEWLHAFDWFGDMASVPNSRERAMDYVDRWIAQYGSYNRFAWRPDILARRLCAWLLHWQPLLDTQTESSSTRRRAVARQARFLRRNLSRVPPGIDRICAHVALALLAVRTDDGQDGLARAQSDLSEQLAEQILPDGAHVSRSPETTLEVLRILRGLDSLLEHHGLVANPGVARAMDRLAPMIAFFSHTDGQLAAFHGGGEGDAGLISTVTTPLTSKPFAFAPHAKYQRLSREGTVILMDVGEPAPFPFDGEAHLAPLAFEMSVPAGRLIVNCGWSPMQPGSWHDAVRRTPAHSTLIAGGADAGRLGDAERLAIPYTGTPVDRGARPVHVSRREAEPGIVVEGSHSGYVPRFGRTHSRRLFLSASGKDVRGEDSLVPGGDGVSGAFDTPGTVVLRFHLHPDVRAVMAESLPKIVLHLDGETWEFLCNSRTPPRLEDSAYLAVGSRPRPCQQIVVELPENEGAHRLQWALKCVEDGESRTPSLGEGSYA